MNTPRGENGHSHDNQNEMEDLLIQEKRDHIVTLQTREQELNQEIEKYNDVLNNALANEDLPWNRDGDNKNIDLS